MKKERENITMQETGKREYYTIRVSSMILTGITMSSDRKTVDVVRLSPVATDLKNAKNFDSMDEVRLVVDSLEPDVPVEVIKHTKRQYLQHIQEPVILTR